jgi:hypothetical protein
MRARRPKSVKCRRCKRKLRVKWRGPLPVYCRSCRQRHYEEGLAGRAQKVLAQEINSLKVQQIVRAEVERYLARIKIVWSEPSATAKPKKRPALYIVRKDATDQPPPTAPTDR